MKKIISLLMVCFLGVVGTGCGNSGNGGKNSADKFLSYNYSSILEQFEEKEIEEGIFYREMYQINDSGSIELNVVVYNNTDNAVRISARAQGYKNGVKTSQVGQSGGELVLAHSAYPVGFYLMDADSYKLERIKVDRIEDKALKNNSYSFESYSLAMKSAFINYNDEYQSMDIPMLSIYFKYQDNGENSAQVSWLGFKDNKLVCDGSQYVLCIDDENVIEYSKEVSENGDRGMVDLYSTDAYRNGITMNDLDEVVYFVTGRYE